MPFSYFPEEWTFRFSEGVLSVLNGMEIVGPKGSTLRYGSDSFRFEKGESK